MKSKIIEAGLEIAVRDGLHGVLCTSLATRLGISHQAILYYFKTADGLRVEICREAIKRENLPMIAQMVAINHPLAKKLPAGLKERAVASLMYSRRR